MSMKIHTHLKNEKSTTRIETYDGFDELLGYADAEYMLEDVVDVLSKYYTYEDETFDDDQAKDDPEFTIKIEDGDERADYYTENIFYVHLPNKEAAEELAQTLGGKLDESKKSEGKWEITRDEMDNKFLPYLGNQVVATRLTSQDQLPGYDNRFNLDKSSTTYLIEPNPDFNVGPNKNVRSVIVSWQGEQDKEWVIRIYPTADKSKGVWDRSVMPVDDDAHDWRDVARYVTKLVLTDSTESKKESNMNAHKFGNKSEASRYGSGMATRKDFSKTRNLGDILEVLEEHRKLLKSAAEDMSQSKADLEAAIKRLEEFDESADFLKQQSVKGIKKAIAIKNSPEVQASGEIIDALKSVISIVAADYANIPDVKQLMTVSDSRYATRGSQILTTMEGQVSRAIEVDMKTLKDSIDSGDVTEDDVMKFVTTTTITHGVQSKGVVEKVTPILEKMNAMVDASAKLEEAVIDPKQFKELRDLVEQIVSEASAPKDTFRTSIVALDKDTIASIPTESKVSEGLLDKLKSVLSAIKDKISMLWDSFTSLFFSIEDEALESADVFSEVEVSLALVGIEVYESRKSEKLGKKFEVLTKSVLTCCDKLVKDASLAGEFDDEVIYAEDAVKNAVESFQHLGEACKTLKSVLSYHKNEDNMNVIGILADAITQIVADDAGEEGGEGSEGGDGETGGESVLDQIDNEYSPAGGEENEEPSANAAPNPAEMGEPEEF